MTNHQKKKYNNNDKEKETTNTVKKIELSIFIF